MRSSILILATMMLAGGCASQQPAAPIVVRPTANVSAASVPIPSASALAFTPPVAYGVADELALDRDGRRVAAYGEYESVVISETWSQQDDRQYFSRHGGDQSTFERRAVSTRVTIGGR